MSPEEKRIIAKEKKQILGFLAALREQTEIISQQLSEMITRIARIREAYLGLKVMIDTFEEKLGK